MEVVLDHCLLSSCFKSISEGFYFDRRKVIPEGFTAMDMQACTW